MTHFEIQTEQDTDARTTGHTCVTCSEGQQSHWRRVVQTNVGGCSGFIGSSFPYSGADCFHVSFRRRICKSPVEWHLVLAWHFLMSDLLWEDFLFPCCVTVSPNQPWHVWICKQKVMCDTCIKNPLIPWPFHLYLSFPPSGRLWQSLVILKRTALRQGDIRA